MALDIIVAQLIFLVALAFSQVASREVTLAQQGFDQLPTNLIFNQTSQFVLLDNETNIIRGWPYQGTVWYVITRKSSLTGNGNGLQLGPNGMISYTVYCAPYVYCFLTFRLAPSSPSCANATAVNVSDPRFSKVFLYKESLGKETWQTHAYSFRGIGYVTLQIQSVSTVSHGNIACWPIIDDLLLTGINHDEIRENDGVKFNLFWNRGFEVGPGFSEYSSQGILLEAEPNLNITLPVQQLPLYPWMVLGTVKYIDSNHYEVPKGRRAVELISASGNPSGIAYNLTISGRERYTLEFIMGDAGHSCVGDFTVIVEIGPFKWNFLTRSNGVGSSKKYSVKFQLNGTHITNNVVSFISYNETRTSDHQDLCGPVIDAMFVGIPSGLRSTRVPSVLVIFVSIVTFFFFA